MLLTIPFICVLFLRETVTHTFTWEQIKHAYHTLRVETQVFFIVNAIFPSTNMNQ